MAAPFVFGGREGAAHVGWSGRLREVVRAGLSAAAGIGGSRKTVATQAFTLPAVLAPWTPGARGAGQAPAYVLPKPTPANLRKFAEVPAARRAINVVKDRIASMDWQVRLKRDAVMDAAEATDRLRVLRAMLLAPNPQDSFRVLLEQVLEDVIVGGFGAVEIERTGDAMRPLRLWPVDGATVQIDPAWKGDAETPRYVQAAPRMGLGVAPGERGVALLDRELMYIRLNPRTYTAFGLGRLEVAFESVHQMLTASRYANKLASNGVAQYALWLDEATPQQHERLIRWWQEEVEGTAQVPIFSSTNKPEVLRFAQGTDAELRLQWQEFLLRTIAIAFDLPPMLLGVQHDVNRSTAAEMAQDAFQSAIVPLAKLVAEHMTQDVIGKALGWEEFEFVFNDLESRDEATEVAMQVQLLEAGVLTVDEVRAMRGLGPKVVEEAESGIPSAV